MDLYYFSYGDTFITRQFDLALYPAHEAHLFNASITKAWAQQCTAFMHTAFAEKIAMRGPYALPLRPLLGVMAPALSIEMGIKRPDDWQLFVEPLVTMIQQLVQQASIS
jgi:hypothetical protein